MMLTTHFHPVLRLGMRGAVLPLLMYAFMRCTETSPLQTVVCILCPLLQETRSVNYNIMVILINIL